MAGNNVYKLKSAQQHGDYLKETVLSIPSEIRTIYRSRFEENNGKLLEACPPPPPPHPVRFVFLFRRSEDDDDEPMRERKKKEKKNDERIAGAARFRNIVVVKSRKLLINERSTSANKIITRDKIIV